MSCQPPETPVLNQAPQLSLGTVAPSFPAPASVTVTATATDDQGIRDVRFLRDGALASTVAAAPYTYTANFSAAEAGQHSITVIATDLKGLQTQRSVSFSVGQNIYLPGSGFWSGQRAPGPWCTQAAAGSNAQRGQLGPLTTAAAELSSRAWNLTVTPAMRQAQGIEPGLSDALDSELLLPLGQESEQDFGQALERLKAAGPIEIREVKGWWVRARVSGEQARSLRDAGLIQYAEQVKALTLSGLPAPTDPVLNNETTYEAMTGVSRAHALLDQGCDHPVIAVVDSGWTASTAGYEANLVEKSAWFDAVIDTQGQAATKWTGSGALHGSATGGLIASVTNDGIRGSGLNYNLSKVLPINVMSNGEDGRAPGSMYSDNIEQAIEYASGSVVIGSKTFVNPHPAQIVNLSLGSSSLDANYIAHLSSVAQKAASRGTLIVASTGNEGAGAFDYAVADSTFGVAAAQPNGQLATFSNRGPGTDVMAPGSNVGIMVDGQETNWSGTSFAAPWFASQLSLWMYSNAHRTGSFTAGLSGQALFDAATQCVASAGQPRNDTVGYGLIDTAKLVDPNNASCAR